MDPNIHYINKQTLNVVIFTKKYKIEGNIHVLYNHRALDILNERDSFIAVTKAKMSELGDDKKRFYEGDFLALNKNEIVMLYEE